MSETQCFLCEAPDAPRHVCPSCVARALDALGKPPERTRVRTEWSRHDRTEAAAMALDEPRSDPPEVTVSADDALTDEEWGAQLVAAFRAHTTNRRESSDGETPREHEA